MSIGGEDRKLSSSEARPAPVAVYYINLARRPDRRAAMEAMLERVGVPFERIDAVDAQALSDAELDRDFRPSGPIGSMNRGDKACTLSHMKAMQRLLDSEHKAAVILEDDIRVAPDLAGLCESLDWLPPGVGLVKLETCPVRGAVAVIGRECGRTPAGRRLHPLLSRHTGAAGYLIDRKSAGMVLADRGRIDVIIDHLIFNPNVSALARSLHGVQVVPALVDQQHETFGTDLGGERRSDKPKGARYLWRQVVRGLYDVRLVPAQALALAFGGARVVKVEWAETAAPAADTR